MALSNTENKSSRNKTLNISVEEGASYFKKCLRPDDSAGPLSLEEIQEKTINGDSFKVLPLLPEHFIDLAIIDPPYNLAKNYAGNKFNSVSRKDYFEYTEKWLSLLLPHLKENASFYICCDWKSSMVIQDVLCKFEDDKKLIIQNRITWQREKGRGARQNWKNAMEDIWFCTLGSDYTFNLDAVKIRRRVIAPYKVDGQPKDWADTEGGKFRDTCPGNFWDDISIPFWSMAENTAHPTQKPEKLLAKLIMASSNPGDFIFDPFLGSGSTSVVAKKLGRKFCGIEQSDLYCTWAEKRLADAEEDKSIQGFKDGVFWERNALNGK